MDSRVADRALRAFATPRDRRTVLAVALFLFLTAPLAVARYFIVEYNRGAYPPDGDIIAIPIFGFAVFWAATAPVTWGFVWLCTRRYPGRVPLWAWNHDRPLWSAAWTLAVAVAFAWFVLGTPWPQAAGHPSLIAHVLSDLWFMLVLRSAIVRQAPSRGFIR